MTVLLRPGRLQQRQQRTPKCLHLLLDLCSGVEPCRGELRPQARILFREAIVLGSEDGHLLSDTSTGLSLVPLLLSDLSPVTPEAGVSGFGVLAHDGPLVAALAGWGGFISAYPRQMQEGWSCVPAFLAS